MTYQTKSTHRKFNFQMWRADRGIFAFVLLAAICLVVYGGTAFGQQRRADSRATFKAGGERSEIVLREISLKMDQIILRLERIEQNTADARAAELKAMTPTPTHAP